MPRDSEPNRNIRQDPVGLPGAGKDWTSTATPAEKDFRDMFIVGNFVIALATVIDYILVLYMWIVIARAVLSWVNPDPYNTIVRIIYNMTEPVLYQIRNRLPVTFGGIDLSPIVIFLVIIFLQKFVVTSLYVLGNSLL